MVYNLINPHGSFNVGKYAQCVSVLSMFYPKLKKETFGMFVVTRLIVVYKDSKEKLRGRGILLDMYGILLVLMVEGTMF